MTDLTAEGRETLRNFVPISGNHVAACTMFKCVCGLTAIRDAIPDLLRALAAAEAEREHWGNVALSEREGYNAAIDRLFAAEKERNALRAALEKEKDESFRLRLVAREAITIGESAADEGEKWVRRSAALRAALQSAVAACPRRCNEGTYRYPTWQGWEVRPCKVCGPWRKVLSEGKV